MGVQVKREDPKPVVLPIEQVTLQGPGHRAVVVRPVSTGKTNVRTVEVHSAIGFEGKWAATLGDLRSFGQALIDIADGK